MVIRAFFKCLCPLLTVSLSSNTSNAAFVAALSSVCILVVALTAALYNFLASSCLSQSVFRVGEWSLMETFIFLIANATTVMCPCSLSIWALASVCSVSDSSTLCLYDCNVALTVSSSVRLLVVAPMAALYNFLASLCLSRSVFSVGEWSLMETLIFLIADAAIVICPCSLSMWALATVCSVSTCLAFSCVFERWLLLCCVG